MPSRHVILSSSGLVVAALACTSPAVSFIEATNTAPVTPADGRPIEWTPAPTTTPGWKEFTGSHTELRLPERHGAVKPAR